MDYTFISPEIKGKLVKLLSRDVSVLCIIQAIGIAGGSPYLVGGAVRDLMLNVPIHDIDIEVYGLTYDALELLLGTFGTVHLQGKAYGVLRVENIAIDWSIPRQDQEGRKPYVTLNSSLTIHEACMRRDLTMNAMGINLLTDEFVDPLCGMQDIRLGILRTPQSTFFVQDPLRFYRVMQFIGRFEMYPDQALQNVCAAMDVSQVSRERSEQEYKKLMLYSRAPSRGLRWLHTLGRLRELLPELGDTVGIIQPVQWHPEGDVFEHTMQALDASASLIYQNQEEKLIIMYAVLCHDLGKVETTRIIEGRIRSIRHEKKGVAPTRALLRRMVCSKRIIRVVEVLVRYHMEPGYYVTSPASDGAYKLLAYKLAPHATLAMLALVARADRCGRNADDQTPLPLFHAKAIDAFIDRARALGVLYKHEAPVLKGGDLLDSIEPGPMMKDRLDKAYRIQVQEGIRDKMMLKRRVVNVKE
ncbi:MAG: hypothetical protein WBQ73_04145 [Candidatus Babeliales bacterium]